VRSLGLTALNDLVASGNKVFLSHHDIRKSAIHHDAYLAEAFIPSWQRIAEVMNEILVKEVIDAVDVVFVLEKCG